MTIFPPSALLYHLRRDVLRHQIRPFKAHRDNFIEFLFRAVKNISVIRQRGVVDENIDAAEASDDLIYHCLHVARFRNVAQHEHGLVTSLIDFIHHRLAAPLCVSITAILAPSAANSFAIALPIFLPAPVMTATCPCNFIP